MTAKGVKAEGKQEKKVPRGYTWWLLFSKNMYKIQECERVIRLEILEYKKAYGRLTDYCLNNLVYAK